MGRTAKRKYHEFRPASHSGPSGVGDTLDQVKRARTDTEAASDLHDTATNGADHSAAKNSGEWHTVVSKSSRRRANAAKAQRQHQNQKQKQNSEQHEPADGPRLFYNSRVNDDHNIVTIKELRDLVLYILADGVAPNFVAVKQSRDIRKVVVLMLPGLDDDLMQRAEQIFATETAKPREPEFDDLVLPPQSNLDASVSVDDAESGIELPDHSLATQNAKFVNQQISVQTLPRLLKERWKVRAPGDPKWSKVHSPLQSMLMKGAGPDRPHAAQSSEKNFQPVHTQITDFVHSADELRDAEYPIHPATFSSEVDGALEAERREGAGQVASDGWVDSNVTVSSPVVPAALTPSPKQSTGQGLDIYAIDCEMVLTADEKSSLARVSLVSWPDGKVVLDEYVKPELVIINYFTQYSGITPQILENVTTTLAQIQAKLLPLFTPSTILLGHSLESDLNALKMTHPFIIDTSMIYPHPRGLPLRSSLKFLANKYLRREIQAGGANGHDSVEDARAVLDLVKLKCEKGPKWGTTEALGETVFKRISKHHGADGKRHTSAMIEYGTPERGLGKDATVTIGCQDDDEIISNMLKATLGYQGEDQTGNLNNSSIPKSGVDFTWGRLRALEFARGWVTNNVKPSSVIPSPSPSSDENANKTSDNDDLDPILHQTFVRLDHLITQLSSSSAPTLVILFSGTSDMRPVLRYQAMQAQYRKEFKVKKWDELSVKWTDAEEVGLRKAVEAARMGWGWAGIL